VTLQRGDAVRHAVWGDGVVVKRLASKAVRVVFVRSPTLPRTFRLSDRKLRSLMPAAAGAGPASGSSSASFVEENAPAPKIVAPTPADFVPPTQPIAFAEPSFASDLDHADAWQTLEALRLGVVPARGVQEYTVAREAELASIGEMYDDNAGCRVLWGDYGTGKTHLLETAEQLALERGFATARVTLDPKENALHHPLRLYQRIANSMRTSDQVGMGLDWLFEQLCDSDDHFDPGGKRASRFFSPYLHVLRKGTTARVGWMREYVFGEDVPSQEVNSNAYHHGWRGGRLLRMSDYRTFGRMYMHLLGTLSCWYADAGKRGLVLLFDEVERVEALNHADRGHALEVLQHYAAVTMQPDDLAFEPDSLYKGGREVHRELPLRFRDQQPLSTIFALTPLEEIRAQFLEITQSETYDVHIGALHVDLLKPLVARIAGIYERAYVGHTVSEGARGYAHEQLRDSFESGHSSFRDAVRAAVFLFDANRLADNSTR